MMNKSHVFSTIAICLVVCQVAVVILSWILTAAFPNLPLRSVLSGEGIRWMVGSFSKSVAAVYMMWLFFGTIAVGCLQYSGLSYVLRKKQSNYRERMALKIVYGECIIVVAIISLMIFLPHSIFLNVSGNYVGPMFDFHNLRIGIRPSRQLTRCIRFAHVRNRQVVICICYLHSGCHSVPYSVLCDNA